MPSVMLRKNTEGKLVFYVPKKDLEEVGLFDENFLHGGYEDIDLFLRYKK